MAACCPIVGTGFCQRDAFGKTPSQNKSVNPQQQLNCPDQIRGWETATILPSRVLERNSSPGLQSSSARRMPVMPESDTFNLASGLAWTSRKMRWPSFVTPVMSDFPLSD